MIEELQGSIFYAGRRRVSRPRELFMLSYKQGIIMQAQHIEQVIKKLQALAPNRLHEVEDFIDFLSQRDSDRQLTQAAMAVSEPALRALWDNADDAEYDKL